MGYCCNQSATIARGGSISASICGRRPEGDWLGVIVTMAATDLILYAIAVIVS